MFSKIRTNKSIKNYSEQIDQLKREIASADAVFIGAGSGLSTAAGFTYSGERFEKYFGDFIRKYGIRDMYTGGFYPFPTPEEFWGWWARHIYVNRYMDVDPGVYPNLLKWVQDKDYFVITTNVDHQFQKAGFDKQRLFYMQGDYGLLQCKEACHEHTYDNYDIVVEMLLSQGFLQKDGDRYTITDPSNWKTSVATETIPVCPRCGEAMAMNLRSDDTFVQDEGWYTAQSRYNDFVRRHQSGHVLYLELGVGANTPVWIKYPFWRMTYANPNAVYACLNQGQAFAPKEIEKQSICIDGDIAAILQQ